jgi:CRISPR-associated protein Cas2
MVNSKQLVVVAYDITSNRRRALIAKVLVKYGTRANFSVFECLLTQARLKEMKTELHKAMKYGKGQKTDNVLFYYLCPGCVANRSRIAGEEEPPEMVKVL